MPRRNQNNSLNSRRNNVVDMEEYRRDRNKPKKRPIKKRYRKTNKNNKKLKKIKSLRKKSNNSTKKRDFFLIFIMIIFVVALLSIVVYRYSQISIMKYDMIDISNEIAELDNEIKVLNLKIDSVSSSKIMEEKAKNIGMNFRQKENIVYVLVE